VPKLALMEMKAPLIRAFKSDWAMGGIMAAQNFAISSLMEVDDVSLVQQNGVSYLKVKAAHLTSLG
jgi:hypothetical protein